MLFLTLLLAHTLSFSKSLKTKQYIQCLETDTSPPNSFNALPVLNTLSYSVRKLFYIYLPVHKLVLMFTCLMKKKSEVEINTWKRTVGDSLKRNNRNGGQHKQLLLPQAAHLHLWQNSYRIGKVSWKPNFFVMCCLFVQHDCLEGTRGGATQ